ncbi:MAG: hypothetical protein U1A78_13150 [Polyangia bacterium]
MTASERARGDRGRSRRRRASCAPGLAALGLGGLGVLVASGCSLSEPFLVPRKAAELMTEVPDNARKGALLPALREKDREPVTLRYRHLYLDDPALKKGLGRADEPAFLRVRATKASPFLMVGGVILGMGVAHIGLGVGAAVDQPTSQRAYSDGTGALVAMILGGLHLVVGGGLMVYGEKHPTVEPADRALVDPYIRGEIPTATAQEEPLQRIVPSAIDVKNSGEGEGGESKP